MTRIRAFFFCTILNCTLAPAIHAQQGDTVILDLSSSSRLIFTLGDRDDLKEIRQYDYEAIFEDIFSQIEGQDPVVADIDNAGSTDRPSTGNTWYDEDEQFWSHSKAPALPEFPQSRFRAIFDFGINNYHIADPASSDENQLTVRPWGSWYIAGQFQRQFWFTKNFHIELGAGFSNSAFKFQDDATLLVKTDDEVSFMHDEREIPFIKSTLQVSHVNVTFVPVFNTGLRKRHADCDHWHHSRFRLGVGAYAGYRLWSSAKQRFVQEGKKINDKNRDSFYLNTFRYGLRAQFGIEGTDFFFNYDLSTLFQKNKGPELNAYSFGLLF